MAQGMVEKILMKGGMNKYKDTICIGSDLKEVINLIALFQK
jgi:hypothetical protein